uniref:Uncharacterized protein n=1 Tax=viral metagenome TaxID=1070528 RepID=A0A6M3LIL3_9ZZZZ
MAVSEIAGLLRIILEIIDKRIDDPNRRVEATQDVKDGLKKLIIEALDDKNVDKVDRLVDAFSFYLHKL